MNSLLSSDPQLFSLEEQSKIVFQLNSLLGLKSQLLQNLEMIISKEKDKDEVTSNKIAQFIIAQSIVNEEIEQRLLLSCPASYERVCFLLFFDL